MRLLPKALACYRDALAISRETGDRYGEGLTLTNLGLVHDHLRKFTTALDCHQKALVICRELGDRYGEAQTLGNLAFANWELGQRGASTDCWQQALAIFEVLNVPMLAQRMRAALAITEWVNSV